MMFIVMIAVRNWIGKAVNDMVNDFNGFGKGVIGKKLPSDTTLNNMKKADLIKLLHIAQHNYETVSWFYNNAVNANMAQLNNNGWIPCSERLPKVETTVLIHAKRKYTQELMFIPLTTCFHHAEVATGTNRHSTWKHSEECFPAFQKGLQGM